MNRFIFTHQKDAFDILLYIFLNLKDNFETMKQNKLCVCVGVVHWLKGKWTNFTSTADCWPKMRYKSILRNINRSLQKLSKLLSLSYYHLKQEWRKIELKILTAILVSNLKLCFLILSSLLTFKALNHKGLLSQLF